MNIPLIDTALAFAKGQYIFPCGPNKKPRVEHGFHDATQDEVLVREWWTKHPDSLIAMPTGAKTRLMVIDDDTAGKPDVASSAWVNANRARLEATMHYATRSGGTHYMFSIPDGVKISSKQGITVGGQKLKSIDTRGDGGYIIWWPAHGSKVTGEIQPLPPELVAQLTQPTVAVALPSAAASPEWNPDEARRALSFIVPPQTPGYGAWTDIGMALHHASGGSEEGLALWDEHSSGSLTTAQPDNYKGEGDCRAHWVSFGKDKKRAQLKTIGTLYMMAKVNGYKPQPAALDTAAVGFGTGPKPAGMLTASTQPALPIAASSYRFQSLDDVLTRPDLEWLVEDVLPKFGLASVFGEWGTGKSFLVIDIAGAVATGKPWFGRQVQQAPVLYVVLEGDGGIKQRMQAYTLARNVKPTQLQFVTGDTFNLLGNADITRMQATLRATNWRNGLLIVDTLSAAIPGGNENAPEVMSAVVEALKALQREFGGLMLIVHHSGKDESKGMRGNSNLPAAMDAQIKISREAGQDQRWWVSDKLKDGPDDARVGFKLKSVTVGRDKRGKPITSCVVVPDGTDGALAVPKRMTLTGGQQSALQIIRGVIAKSSMKTDEGQPCVPLLVAESAVADTLMYGKRSNAETQAGRTIRSLNEMGVLGFAKELVWVLPQVALLKLDVTA